MTLGSRVGGLVRDVVIGRVFGVTVIGSAFQAAFAIPNMFRRLFGEGALSAAFIPEYTAALREDPKVADKLASLTLLWLGLLTTALTLAIELVLGAYLILLPQTEYRALLLKFVLVMLPFMPLICTVAVQAGILQVHGRYGPAASGPIILNTFIVGAGLYFILTNQLGGQTTAYVLALATVASGVTQMFWFFHLLRPHVRWTRDWRAARPRARVMLKRFLPVAVGLGTLQLNTFLDTLIATYPIAVGPTFLGRDYPLDESSNAILSLTARLYQFPLGVFGVSIASAIFPLLSRHAKQPDHFADTLRRGLRLALYIGLPATLGLILVRHDALSVLYGHGRHGWSSGAIDRAANVLAGFSVGIWAYSLNQVFTRCFYAQGDTRTPMNISLAMILVNVALNLTLIWIPGVREAGLAWSTAISAILQTLILSAFCTRMLARLGAHHPLADPHARAALARVALASILMAALVWLLLVFLPRSSPFAHAAIPPWLTADWSWQLTRLALATLLGGLSYLTLSKLLHIPELSWLLHRAPPETSSPAI
jgi:putative peptidoglycan lipid II flippase